MCNAREKWLRELRGCADAVLRRWDLYADDAEAAALAESFRALDEWLSGDGKIPPPWEERCPTDAAKRGR